MKTILYICTEAAPGLVAYSTGVLLAASRSECIDVRVITVDDEKCSYRPYLHSLPPDRVCFLQKPKKLTEILINKFYAKNVLREVKKICGAHEIDFIHLLTVDYTCATIFRRIKKIHPVYYTVHDAVPHEKAFAGIRDYFFYTYFKWGARRMLQKADFAVTNSKSQYRLIKAMYPLKNIYFHLFPPLITESILSGKNTCPELKNMNSYILFFGNIEKYKGIEYLYEAYINNRRLHDYRLVIAGQGFIYFPHTDDPRILFINRHIADEEVKSLYTNAVCVVYPYISATQSGVLTLACKFQTPALVSDLPFFREVSDDKSCLFFNCTDAGDLSDKLETLLFHTDLNEMKNAQKKYFDHSYSEKAIISSIEQIYIK